MKRRQELQEDRSSEEETGTAGRQKRKARDTSIWKTEAAGMRREHAGRQKRKAGDRSIRKTEEAGMRQEYAGRQAGGRNLGAVGRSQKKTWETETAERIQDNMGEDWCIKEEAILERDGRREQQREETEA